MIQSTLFSLGRRRRRRHRRRRVSSRHWCGVCGALRRLARECARDAAQSRRLLPEAPQRCHRFARFVNLHRSGRLHILLLGLGQRRLSWPRRLGNRGLPLAQPASASHACATLCKHLFRWPHAWCFRSRRRFLHSQVADPYLTLACSLWSCSRARGMLQRPVRLRVGFSGTRCARPSSAPRANSCIISAAGRCIRRFQSLRHPTFMQNRQHCLVLHA